MAQLDDELFYQKITNPEIEKRYQWEDLPPRYRKFSNGRKYPVREVLQIVRVRRPDFAEWLKSRGRIVGLDKLGNEVEHSFTDPEMYFTPQTKYELKAKEPKNPDGLKERVCVEAGINEAVAETKGISFPSMQRTLIHCLNHDRWQALLNQAPASHNLT